MAITIQKDNPYDKHLQAKPIKGKVTIEKKHAGDDPPKLVTEKDELVNPGITIPPDKMYRLRVDGGATVNLGNYESARIGVSLDVPCTKEDLTQTYNWAVEWVGERINQAVKDAKGT